MSSAISDIPVKNGRRFFPQNLPVNSWEVVEPLYKELQQRELSSLKVLENWLLDRSELEAVLSEELGWRYILSSCDTSNEEYQKRYNFFIEEIEPCKSAVILVSAIPGIDIIENENGQRYFVCHDRFGS